MTVTINGVGTFEIPNDKLPELIQWLENNSVRLESTKPIEFNGQTLING